MKTKELESLLAAIGTNPWTFANAAGRFYISSGPDYVCRTPSDKAQDNTNARAIALVPELIAEVIRLRGENEALTRKLDIAYNGLTTVKKITDGSQPKDYPSVPTVAAYVLGELA